MNDNFKALKKVMLILLLALAIFPAWLLAIAIPCQDGDLCVNELSINLDSGGGGGAGGSGGGLAASHDGTITSDGAFRTDAAVQNNAAEQEGGRSGQSFQALAETVFTENSLENVFSAPQSFVNLSGVLMASHFENNQLVGESEKGGGSSDPGNGQGGGPNGGPSKKEESAEETKDLYHGNFDQAMETLKSSEVELKVLEGTVYVVSGGMAGEIVDVKAGSQASMKWGEAPKTETA